MTCLIHCCMHCLTVNHNGTGSEHHALRAQLHIYILYNRFKSETKPISLTIRVLCAIATCGQNNIFLVPCEWYQRESRGIITVFSPSDIYEIVNCTFYFGDNETAAVALTFMEFAFDCDKDLVQVYTRFGANPDNLIYSRFNINLVRHSDNTK